jgi:hypothetical protein
MHRTAFWLFAGYMSEPDGMSLQGGSPVSAGTGTALLLSRALSPLDADHLDSSVISFRSGHMTARSIRSTCTGIHNKVPLMPWYKRDVFAGALCCVRH